MPTFKDCEKEVFPKHCGKRRKCHLPKKICPMLATLKLSSAKALNFDKAKILPSGKG